MFEYTHTHSKNFKHFAWTKNSPQASPSGDWPVTIISDPASWHLVYHCHRFDFTNVYNYRHNCFIIIISDYHLSVNSQLLWPARCPGIWSIVTDSISQVTRSKSGEIRNQSLQALCFAMISIQPHVYASFMTIHTHPQYI